MTCAPHLRLGTTRGPTSVLERFVAHASVLERRHGRIIERVFAKNRNVRRTLIVNDPLVVEKRGGRETWRSRNMGGREGRPIAIVVSTTYVDDEAIGRAPR